MFSNLSCLVIYIFVWGATFGRSESNGQPSFNKGYAGRLLVYLRVFGVPAPRSPRAPNCIVMRPYTCPIISLLLVTGYIVYGGETWPNSVQVWSDVCMHRYCLRLPLCICDCPCTFCEKKQKKNIYIRNIWSYHGGTNLNVSAIPEWFKTLWST